MCVGTQTGEEGPHCHSTTHTGGKAMAPGTQDHSLYSLYPLYLMAGTEEGKRNPAKLPSGSEQGTCTWREKGVAGRRGKRKRKWSAFPQCFLALQKSRDGKLPHQRHSHPAAAVDCKHHAGISSPRFGL